MPLSTRQLPEPLVNPNQSPGTSQGARSTYSRARGSRATSLTRQASRTLITKPRDVKRDGDALSARLHPPFTQPLPLGAPPPSR